MREYLGFWFYYQLWSPDEIPEMKVEIDLLFQRVKKRRDHNLPGAPNHQDVLEHRNEQEIEELELVRLEREIEEIESNKSVIDNTALRHPRKWLTEPAIPLILQVDARTILEEYDEENEHPSCWLVYSGNDPRIIIAQRMARLFKKYIVIFSNSRKPEELLQASRIKYHEIPDLGLLLLEQTVLEKCLNQKNCKILSDISDTEFEYLSDQAAAARKEAAAEMLKEAVNIWRARYARYKSRTLVIPVLTPQGGYCVLQVAPNSITDFVHGDEAVVVRENNPDVKVEW